jgi:oligopeptide/dipeptide ABC transporter ATP-binding protein
VDGADKRRRLNEIKGIVPSLYELPAGCTFAPRCRYATTRCREQFPPLGEVSPGHWAACWHTDQVLHAAQ